VGTMGAKRRQQSRTKMLIWTWRRTSVIGGNADMARACLLMTQSGHQGAAREKREEARIDPEGPTARLCSRAFAPSDIGLANSTRAFIVRSQRRSSLGRLSGWA